MRKLLASLAITIGAVGAAHADLEADADAAAGKEKAVACAACHGQEGISPSGAFPNLAGQQTSYLAKQIMDIRDGNRVVPQMAGQVDNFSDQDAWDVAKFFSDKSPALGQADADELLVERGRELYRAGDMAKGIPACAACHTPTGQGIGTAVYPALSGQHADYTVSTLQDFAAGNRANDPANIMRDIASKMSDRDMEAVANYVLGLH
ncbi:c-type cytochrome [Halomonas sp. KAO]|uniref:c-type cytochrome n=1 Tax=unclassified Halomonas TaxID=2609666 RepID=UPI00189FBA41|nr:MULTISPECIES: c-type cytochrome [unclassified Halomonas]MBF7053554.1 c-type cytochrome [Halomonas sp. KAO]MDT0500833.1 c-type cytochrome [Halomonas sp. PAR7]MDT0512569.1 c-type cytochrome [Halomonas sp. LES1]MDT0592849.1 c-type cytochrome [Halomonas sp. PAR8]